MKTALVIVLLTAATPVLAQTITNTRDANGNLPRDKGLSANTNPTNASSNTSMQRPPLPAPAPVEPTVIKRRPH